MENEGPQITIWRMRVACWLSKATYTRTHRYTHTRPGTHTHGHARKHRAISNTYCFPTARMIRESASVVRTLSGLLAISCY
jgi:hypothetical protein